MKKWTISVIACVLAFTSCHTAASKVNNNANIIVPGTIVAADSETIKEDQLNGFTFNVKIITDSTSSTTGSYIVDATYGMDNAEGTFAMPKNAEHVKPILRRSTEPYTYIIGFKFGEDTTFHDYFEISTSQVALGKKAIKMAYTKAYTFE